MHQEQRQKTKDLLQAQNIDCALFAHRESVTWLTGFAPPVQLGGHHFWGGPSLVWYAGGHFYLITLDWQADLAAAFDADPDGTVISYAGYTIEQPLNTPPIMMEALRGLLALSLPSGGKIGLEMASVSALQQQTLHEQINTGHSLTSIDGWLSPLRMVKTDEELTKLREAFRLADVGHAAARAAVMAGQREIDVWGMIHAAINSAAGERIPLGNDCVVSYREQNIGGWPFDKALHAGDSLMVDLSAGYQGYWSDSCLAYFVSELTPQQATAQRVVNEALDYGISLIRPGAVAREIDQKLRAFIDKAGYPAYPHHSGHGVGAGLHEEPRIVPYNDVVLEAGMVIMLEPGVYLPGELAIRHEDGLLVTADGAEILTKHRLNF